MTKTIGVLALQGAFREHINAIKRTGHFPVEVREVEQLQDIDGLIIPGGESTTISKLMLKYDFFDGIKRFNKPIFGTCAGAILLAKNVPNFDESTLGLLDITVDRNAYGRQIDSFEADLEINFNSGTGPNNNSDNLQVNERGVSSLIGDTLSEKECPANLISFHGIFIRAPKITKIGKEVEILSSYNNEPVLVRESNYLAATFHPELTEDYRVHRMFVEMINKQSTVNSQQSAGKNRYS